MAAFLLKKATLSRKASFRDTKLPDRRSDVAPPSLPPLLLSLSLADPEPNPLAPSLPPAASPPVVALPSPPPEYLSLDDVWDPWKAFADAPRLDSHARPHVAEPSSKKPTPANNASVDVPTISETPLSRSSPVATVSSPRKITNHVRPVPQLVHPKGDALGNRTPTQKQSVRSSSLARPSTSPAVLRGQTVPSSSFDFEESLSAANVTSVVHQYPQPIRHHASPVPSSQDSKMVARHPPSSYHPHHHLSPQKPGSSSSLSSTSNHTDTTRRTNGSYPTSTSPSSVPPPTEVIDVRSRLGHSSNSHPTSNNASVPLRGPSVGYNASAVTSPFSSNPHVHRPPTAPPAPLTSYPERVKSPARSASHPEPNVRTPMLYDMLRSGNPDSVGPHLRKGPLIFAAVSATPQPSGPARAMHAQNPYPSPPTEYTSLEASPPQRRKGSKGSISSLFRAVSQIESHLQEASGLSPTLHSTELPSLGRKASKSSLGRGALERTPSAVARGDANCEYARPRVLTKARPSTPQKPGTPPSHTVLPQPGDPLLLDNDPFARSKGVKMLKPRTPSSSSGTPSLSPPSKEDGLSSEDGHAKTPSTPPSLSATTLPPDDAVIADKAPPTPVTPDDYKVARQQRRGLWLEKAPPPVVAEVVAQLTSDKEDEVVEEPPREPTPPPPTYFPIIAFMSDANLLPLLLSYLTYSQWLALYSANKQIRELFQSRILREFVLERFLSTVGYSKWNYEWAEPIELSLKDLHNYLRGVAMPAHQYARLSTAYLQSKIAKRDAPTASEAPDILVLANTTRAYTRLVLRLRAQAESEERYLKTLQAAESTRTTNGSSPGTRQNSVSSRAPSPTSSRSHSHGKSDPSPIYSSSVRARFNSPLFRPGRAPVLRVFVPSPDGDWLSDASVMECEAELKRSGVLKLLRVGDVVWDVAVGDEGNLGRLIWDGRYLVDLDYRYSRVGELSPYFHSLAFSPSYFHRVVRIGGSAAHNPHCNPLVYIDVSPWGREIATNLQLLQDRARTETPHGALHDVVRWVHRSSFTIRAPAVPSQGQGQTQTQAVSRSRSARVPIPGVEGFYIDPGWYGTVVLESEGTNEGLTDLQARCGPGVFPPRAETLATKMRNEKEKENKRVWRILREKSRPGEIWLRAVQMTERLM